jgi:hypothetical protein
MRDNLWFEKTSYQYAFIMRIAVAKNNVPLAIRDSEFGRPTVTAVFSVIPANRTKILAITIWEDASSPLAHSVGIRPIAAVTELAMNCRRSI